MIDCLPELRILACSRAGTEGIDLDAATKKGIAVLNTPGRNASAVADFTFCLLLDLARRTSKAQAFVHDGRWTGWLAPIEAGLEGTELGGRTLGLIGLGAIGRLVAERAMGFGMSILGYDPLVSEAEFDGENLEFVSLEQLLTLSDFVSIHCALTPKTRNLINHQRLSVMKPSAYIINTARAAIIDEQALITALQAGTIAGAALDVFWEEPLPKNHPLLQLGNVVLTPHIAGLGDCVVARAASMLVDGIEQCLAGTAPDNLVNPQVFRNAR